MLILLYNNAHIGDIFIGQQIITNIIKCNPDKNIKFYCPYNRFIMNDVSGALFLPPPDIEQNLKLFLQHNDHFIFSQMPNPDLLMINFWIAAIRDFTPGKSIECNPDEIQNAVIEGLKKINETHGIIINYNRLSKKELVPIIPFTQTNTFTLWKQQNTKKTLFYFNYLPKSGQTFPFPESYEIHHREIVENILKTNPDLLVLVPSWSGIEHPNILDCVKLFNCVESISCENIYKVNQIASQCDYRIVYDIGACFPFFNSKFSESTCKTFHVSANSLYHPIFKNYLESINVNTENYINVMCSTKDEIIRYFQTVN
jgi:hypothetical protein